MKFEASKDLLKHQVLFAIYSGAILDMIFFCCSTKEPRNPAEQLSAGILVGWEFYFAISEVFKMVHAYTEQIKNEKTNSK